MDKEKQVEKDYAELIDLLNKNKVDYLIVGAYAVMLHTKITRDTKDIDFWIRETKENAVKCAKSIKEFSGLTVAPESLLSKDQIIFLGTAPNRIDFFNAQADLDFDKSFKKKTLENFRDKTAFFISIEDLVAAKKYYLSRGERNLLDSEKDLKDIKRLEDVKEKKKSRGPGR